MDEQQANEKQGQSFLLKRIYQFLQSKIGLIIVIGFYLILHLPLILSSDAFFAVAGEVTGRLLATSIVVLVLTRFFNWTKSQKILHIFLIAFLFEIIQTQESLASIVSVISLISLPILIIQFIFEALKGKRP